MWYSDSYLPKRKGKKTLMENANSEGNLDNQVLSYKDEMEKVFGRRAQAIISKTNGRVGKLKEKTAKLDGDYKNFKEFIDGLKAQTLAKEGIRDADKRRRIAALDEIVKLWWLTRPEFGFGQNINPPHLDILEIKRGRQKLCGKANKVLHVTRKRCEKADRKFRHRFSSFKSEVVKNPDFEATNRSIIELELDLTIHIAVDWNENAFPPYQE
jgi:hypothetical protein